MTQHYQLKSKAKRLAEEAYGIKNDEVAALRLAKRYMSSQYRARKFAEIEAKELAEDEKHREMIDFDAEKNVGIKEYQGLRIHRKTVVRRAARATNIARAFLSGLPYNSVETFPKDVGNRKGDYLLSLTAHVKHWEGPDWKQVTRMIEQYGTREDLKKYHAWLADIGLAIDIEGRVVVSA